MTKVCTKCNKEKPLTGFYKAGKGKPSGRSSCKDCDRERLYKWRDTNKSEYNNYAAMWRAKNPDKQHATDIKRLYGLPIEEYNKLLAAQHMKCKICQKPHDPTRKRGRLYVDHCHNSKKVRGLLCGACNSAIGYMEDRPDLFIKATLYLKINE